MSNYRSKNGYEYQRQETEKILNASKGMKSVSHSDSRGRKIEKSDDVRKSRDLGIDLVTTFTAKNKQALSRSKNKFFKKYEG